MSVRKILLLCGFLMLAYGVWMISIEAAQAMTCERGQILGAVTTIRDGDTIEVDRVPIRLQGMAAPEIDEPGGREAKAFMRLVALGRDVTCRLDGESTHDRCVAICYLAGVDLAELMVGFGLARDCPRFSGGRYRSAELWAGGTLRQSYPLPGYCRTRP